MRDLNIEIRKYACKSWVIIIIFPVRNFLKAKTFKGKNFKFF